MIRSILRMFGHKNPAPIIEAIQCPEFVGQKPEMEIVISNIEETIASPIHEHENIPEINDTSIQIINEPIVILEQHSSNCSVTPKTVIRRFKDDTKKPKYIRAASLIRQGMSEMDVIAKLQISWQQFNQFKAKGFV